MVGRSIFKKRGYMNCVKIYLSPENIYSKLSDEDKKKFNKIMVLDVQKCSDETIEVTYELSNE